MKENITTKVVHCRNPNCQVLHENLDGTGYCESCWPETQYARGAGHEHHPFQPQEISDEQEP